MVASAVPKPAPSSDSNNPGSPGLWAPLTLPAFRLLWIGTVFSNIGTAMQGVGATWLMVSLDARPSMVALLQAAGTIPMFLFGLPAGVLADIVDRRRLLIGATIWMILVSVCLAALSYAGQLNTPLLIGATFGLGMGAAMSAPAFQAVVPELASGALLAPAITLNGIGNNVARTIGPALGGLVVGLYGTSLAFTLNAVSTFAVLFALARWKRVVQPTRLPPEHFFSALVASIRYVEAARGIRTVLIRTLIFFAFASALWALLPLIASQRLGLGASGFGILLTAVGTGSIGGALALARLRKRLSLETLSGGATFVAGLGAVGLALAPNVWLGVVAAAVFGIGWIFNLTLLNVSVQNSVAGWVRARMLAVYVVTFMGISSLATLGWGALAEVIGIEWALLTAGILQALSVLALRAIPFVDPARLDLAPADPGESPLLLDVSHDQEAVLITTDYQVPPELEAKFSWAMVGLENSRRRAGAMAWRHWRDQADPELHREAYVVESWTDYLRLQERRTRSDAEVESEVLALLAPGAKPKQRLFRGVARSTRKPSTKSRSAVSAVERFAATKNGEKDDR